MSTNYYVRPAGIASDDEGIHLGKWAAGEFTFRAYPDPRGNRPAEVTWDVTDYDSWKLLLDLGDIVAEHGMPLTAAEMVSEVRPEPRPYRSRIAHQGQWLDAAGNRFESREFC